MHDSRVASRPPTLNMAFKNREKTIKNNKKLTYTASEVSSKTLWHKMKFPTVMTVTR